MQPLTGSSLEGCASQTGSATAVGAERDSKFDHLVGELRTRIAYRIAHTLSDVEWTWHLYRCQSCVNGCELSVTSAAPSLEEREQEVVTKKVRGVVKTEVAKIWGEFGYNNFMKINSLSKNKFVRMLSEEHDRVMEASNVSAESQMSAIVTSTAPLASLYASPVPLVPSVSPAPSKSDVKLFPYAAMAGLLEPSEFFPWNGVSDG